MTTVSNEALEKAKWSPYEQFDRKVDDLLKKIGDMLKEKNRSYGNSALDPVRIFSKANPLEQLKVRADDKLSRFARGEEYPGEDTLLDLTGYLMIMMIAKDEIN